MHKVKTQKATRIEFPQLGLAKVKLTNPPKIIERQKINNTRTVYIYISKIKIIIQN